MKGFPNQVADLAKIATAIRTLVDLEDGGQNAKDDGVYGPALVRSGVAGRGHVPIPVEQYIQQQLAKKPSNQSFRTTARGLRELFRHMDLIDDSGNHVVVTRLGREAAAFAGQPMNAEQIEFWRRVIRNMTHGETENTTSHPYQVLLRLVGQRPGITRAKCALALEAQNDSPAELARIVALENLPEDQIRQQIGVTEANWDNAKKLLPHFAEQLKDVVVTMVGQDKTYKLADAPGRAGMPPPAAPAPGVPAAAPGAPAARAPRGPRAPRSSRQVTAATIGRAGTAERDQDEFPVPRIADPEAAGRAIAQRLDRLRRHNLIVQALAALLAEGGAQLHEDPFDILALLAEVGILVEVKTLDGTPDDEVARVRDALSQLLYYEAFVEPGMVGNAALHLIACFESPITEPHRLWLNRHGIGVIWKIGDGFKGDELALGVMADYIE